MSAEVLREAASLMRERAEAATPGPWIADVRSDGRAWIDMPDIDDHALGLHGFTADAEHIASWHPTVALAVADLLEGSAARWDDGDLGPDEWDELTAAARTYLGEAS